MELGLKVKLMGSKFGANANTDLNDAKEAARDGIF